MVPTIEVVIIAKNEEAMIARCLESVKGFDCCTVLDTGSIDKTCEIARKYTDKVYEGTYQWEDSFCKARNKALSYATSDWILSIDCDEYLLPGSLQAIRKALEAPTTALCFNIRMEGGSSEFWFPKLFKRCPEVFWKGDCHNYLSVLAKDKVDVTIHYNYSPTHVKDPDRTFRILNRVIAAGGGGPREKFYLAREYMYRKDWKTAESIYNTYLKEAVWGAEMAEAWYQIAHARNNQGNWDSARDACLQSLKINNDYIAPIQFLAVLCGPKNKARWLKFAQQAKDEGVLFGSPRPKAIQDLATLSKPGYPMDLSEKAREYVETLLKEYKTIDVLEWGAGYSTKYFPGLLDREGIEYTWDSIENSKDWYDEVKSWEVKNVTLYYADKDSPEYLNTPTKKYDLIYVDGRNRVKCMQKAKDFLKPGGHVLLHDAERERYKPGFEGYNYKVLTTGTQQLWHGWIDTVPKIIHQIWIGPDEKPVQWMDSWKEKNPNMQYMFWGEKEIDDFGLKNRKVYDDYINLKCYSGASNIARIEILNKYGGVYMDADSMCLVSIEDAPFMKQDFFANYVVDGDTRVANSPMAAIPNHRILQEYIRQIGLITTLVPSHIYSGPQVFTRLIKNKCMVLPPYTFLPTFHSGYKNKVDGVVYAEHYWYTTKKKENG